MNALYNNLNQVKTVNYWLTIFVIFIPILNGLASVTTNYFPPETLNSGFFRVALLMLFLFIAYIKIYVPNKTNNYIVGFVIYWIFLIPFAKNLPFNLIQTPKVVISLLLFPIGYFYINNIEKLKFLLGSILIAWSLFILNFYVSNIFKIGSLGYNGEESSLYFGSGGINIAKAISLIFVLVPFYLKLNESKRNQWLVLTFSILAIPVLLISLKRSALLGLGVGFLTYIFLTPFKGKLLKGAIIVGVVLYSLEPLYWEKFIDVVQIREQRLDFTDPDFAETESRIGEFGLVFQKFIDGSIKHKLVGTDLIYNNYLYNGTRMLHTDYMALLYGTGLIGLLWYFGIYYIIIKKYSSFRMRSTFYREGKATLYALIACSFVLSIAGSIADLNLRSIFFLFAGGLIGTIRTLRINEIISSQKQHQP